MRATAEHLRVEGGPQLLYDGPDSDDLLLPGVDVGAHGCDLRAEGDGADLDRCIRETGARVGSAARLGWLAVEELLAKNQVWRERPPAR